MPNIFNKWLTPFYVGVGLFLCLSSDIAIIGGWAYLLAVICFTAAVVCAYRGIRDYIHASTIVDEVRIPLAVRTPTPIPTEILAPIPEKSPVRRVYRIETSPPPRLKSPLLFSTTPTIDEVDEADELKDRAVTEPVPDKISLHANTRGN